MSERREVSYYDDWNAVEGHDDVSDTHVLLRLSLNSIDFDGETFKATYTHHWTEPDERAIREVVELRRKWLARGLTEFAKLLDYGGEHESLTDQLYHRHSAEKTVSIKNPKFWKYPSTFEVMAALWNNTPVRCARIANLTTNDITLD